MGRGSIRSGILIACLGLALPAHAEKVSRARLVLESFVEYWGPLLSNRWNEVDSDRVLAVASTSGTAAGGGLFTIVAPGGESNVRQVRAGTAVSASGVTGLIATFAFASNIKEIKKKKEEREEAFKGRAVYQAFSKLEGFKKANDLARNLAAEWDLEHLLVTYAPDKDDALIKTWFEEEKAEWEKIIRSIDLPSEELRQRAIERISAERALYRLMARDEDAKGAQEIDALLKQTKQAAIESLEEGRKKLQPFTRHRPNPKATH